MSPASSIFVLLFACAFASTAASQTTTTQPSGAGLKPKPAAPAPQKKPAAAEENSAGVKAIEKIFACIAEGLPKDWGRAWIVVTEIAGDDKEKSFEGKFFYSLDVAGEKPVPLVPCNAREAAQGVYALNEFLEYDKRQWKVATVVFTVDGKFEIKYDYTR